MRFFNTAGPCAPGRHYMLPAAARLADVLRLIDQEAYFVLHGPRQCGKTTTMLDLARQLTAGGRYAAVMLSVETGAAFPADAARSEGAILGSWRMACEHWLPSELQPPPWPQAEPGARLGAAISAWARAIPRPLVLFLDEIDALQDDGLVSVLRQLRGGYPQRPGGFPSSVALVGMRDVRDYKVAAGGSERLHSSSPFNIKLESLTLRHFTAEEVATLYSQHTRETGQVFTPEAVRCAFDLTGGQPWLVNALARQAVEVVAPDPARAIGRAELDRAKQLLIERQDTHLDSLAERLREPRVRRIIEPMLAGRTLGDVPRDDVQFVLDLGLCRMSPTGGLVIANPIYREVMPEVLAGTPMASLPVLTPNWLRPDGTLDPERLLAAFLAFWRQHGQPLLASAPYHEIAPHLVLMAFLHRVANAGGTLEREYAIGSGRMDLCLRHGEATVALELKVWRDGEGDPLEEGLEQLDAYLGGLGLPSGWLVIFDRRGGRPPIRERTTSAPAATPGGRSVTVIRA
ncbi:MAG: ATP-binding protein [Planctomycetes bacterium]|nr:ATP-binding protein [Planctomycetota bacterium]